MKGFNQPQAIASPDSPDPCPTTLKWSPTGDLAEHDALELLHRLAIHDPSVINSCELK